MPTARAQEHKAHTYQNTTHGAASYIISGVHCSLFIISFLLLLVPHAASYDTLPSYFPLPTHKTQQANSLQQEDIYTGLHDGVWPHEHISSAATTGPLAAANIEHRCSPTILLTAVLLLVYTTAGFLKLRRQTAVVLLSQQMNAPSSTQKH